MDDRPANAEAAYHLLLSDEEVPLTASALRLLISDEAHQPQIRRLAREVLAELDAAGAQEGERPHSVALSPQQMKITHSALRLLLNDVRRDQADEMKLLQQILGKLPDEHAIRAIALD
jgi:hypothetical protein